MSDLMDIDPCPFREGAPTPMEGVEFHPAVQVSDHDLGDPMDVEYFEGNDLMDVEFTGSRDQ
jgi:hypothetical protein